LGPESAAIVGRIVVLADAGRPPFVEDEVCPGLVGRLCAILDVDDALGLSFERGGAELDLTVVDGDTRGLSGSFEAEGAWMPLSRTVPLVRPVPLVGVSVRGVFVAEPGNSLSALRFGGAAGRGAGLEGFSPVMEASKSPI